MDSSDDVNMMLLVNGNGLGAAEGGGLSDASASFTFGPRLAKKAPALTRARSGMPTSSSSASSSSSSATSAKASSRDPLKDEAELLRQLKGQRSGPLAPQPHSPLPPRPSQKPNSRATHSAAALLVDSPFASSPRVGLRRGLATLPSTPTGANGGPGRSSALGMNHDGSFSVVRDEEEANNSGLLDLGPFPSTFGRGSGRGPEWTPSRAMAKASPGGPALNKSRPAATRDWGEGGTGLKFHSDGLDSASFPQFQQHARHFEANGSIIEHSLSDVLESEEGEEGAQSRQLLSKLRLWRQDAMEHHLFDTAIFWGEKILWLEHDEGQRPNDAYFLAKAYFLTHQYSRAQHLLTTPLPLITSANASSSNSPGPLSSSLETGPPTAEDALQAAVQGTKQSSILPGSLFQRHLQRAELSGAVPLSLEEDGRGREEEIKEHPSARGPKSPHGLRKRKDRDFTVSGTGTGSESNEGVESDAKSIDSADGNDQPTPGAPQDDDEIPWSPEQAPPADFRRKVKPSSESTYASADATLSLPQPLYDAWQEEQQRSLRDVREAGRQQAMQKRSRGSSKALVDSSAACRYLAAKCLSRLGKLGEALDLIGEESGRWKGGGRYGYSTPSSDGLLKVSSSVSHLRGLIHLRLDNLDQAREAFIEALSLDVKNYDAFSALVDGNLMSSQRQVSSLIEGLQWQAQSAGDAMTFQFIKMCYVARLDKESHEDALRAAAARRALWDEFPGLQGSSDLLYSLAQDLYARRRYRDAFEVSSRIMTLDPDHELAIDLSAGCIASSPSLQKAERPRLFLLANRLVDEHPDRASSWYVVGVWYAISERWAEARRYFSKATLLDPRHLPSWMSFAHSFSLEGESEQAVLAYSSVLRSFPDVAYARVCIGSEHLRMGNLQLARLFLDGGKKPSRSEEGDDERGVLCYLERNYDEAIVHLERALRASDAIAEPQATHLTTRMNLGWAYLKSGRLDDALAMFSNSTSLDPSDANACLGMGMVRHRQGDLADAVGWYHEALSIEPAHVHATELLQYALDEYAGSMSIEDTVLGQPPAYLPLDSSRAQTRGGHRAALRSQAVPSDPAASSISDSADRSNMSADRRHADRGAMMSQHFESSSLGEAAAMASGSLLSASDSGMLMDTRVMGEETEGGSVEGAGGGPLAADEESQEMDETG
ncbi:unnamed protein product [Parajaminaea phylloscopi]